MSYCVAWHTPNACESQLHVPNLCVCDTGRRPNINANLDQVIGWKKEKIKLFIGGLFQDPYVPHVLLASSSAEGLLPL